MIDPNENTASQSIQRVIMACFGRDPPWRPWTTENARLLHEVSPIPMVDPEFVRTIKEAVGADCQESRATTFGLDGDWTGHAWAISWTTAADRTYALAGSMILPIVALRPSGKLDIGDGLDERWPLAADVDSSELERLADTLSPICRARGCTLVPFDSPAIQQRVPCGWFRRRKAWDYLFYFGVPTA